MISSFFATSLRSAPRVGRTCDAIVSATMSTTSPISAPARERSACISSSVMNLAKEEVTPSGVRRIQARPFAPMPRTNSVSLSISLRVSVLTASFAVMPRTVPPPATAPEKTEKPQPSTMSVRS